MKPLLITVVTVSLLALSGSWMAVRRAQAQSNPLPLLTFPVSLGMIGLAPGQTARLNVLNQTGVLLPAQRLQNPVPCSMTLSFLDDQGATLKTTDVNIDSGKAVHLDLAHDDVTRDSSRLQIRGVVQQTVSTSQSVAIPAVPIALGCPVAETLEIFDNASGATRVVLAPATGIGLLGFLGGIANPTP